MKQAIVAVASTVMVVLLCVMLFFGTGTTASATNHDVVGLVPTVTLPGVTVTLPPATVRVPVPGNTVTVTVPVPGPVRTVTVRPDPIVTTVTPPPIVRTEEIRIPGPTVTETVRVTVTEQGQTTTTTIAPAPQPTRTNTVTSTATPQSQPSQTAPTRGPTSAPPSPTVTETTRQDPAESGTLAPSPGLPESEDDMVDFGDGNVTIAEAGITTLLALLMAAGGLALLYGGYILGYKKSEELDTNFMRDMRDTLLLGRHKK